jgi:hypothetical protein
LDVFLDQIAAAYPNQIRSLGQEEQAAGERFTRQSKLISSLNKDLRKLRLSKAMASPISFFRITFWCEFLSIDIREYYRSFTDPCHVSIIMKNSEVSVWSSVFRFGDSYCYRVYSCGQT